MNITNIKTFIAVAETGSFLGAADRVHVTQSTVSIRIRSLEDRLGVYLFDRGKQGAVLTQDGHKFLKHAIAIINLWDQARIEVGLSSEQDSIIRIGGQVSLWDGYLSNWLAEFKASNQDIAVRAEMGNPTHLIERMTNGELDVLIIYRPQYRPGYEAHTIFEEELILVSTEENNQTPFDDRYILMHWGPDFIADHSLNFPDIDIPSVSMDLGTLGLDYLFNRGGSAFFPRRTVARYLKSAALFAVPNVPHFTYPVYAMYAQSFDAELADKVLSSLNKAGGMVSTTNIE